MNKHMADARDFYVLSGKAVWQQRDTLRLTLRDLAKVVGVSASTISRFENGKNIDAVNYVSLTNWLLYSAALRGAGGEGE